MFFQNKPCICIFLPQNFFTRRGYDLLRRGATCATLGGVSGKKAKPLADGRERPGMAKKKRNGPVWQTGERKKRRCPNHIWAQWTKCATGCGDVIPAKWTL